MAGEEQQSLRLDVRQPGLTLWLQAVRTRGGMVSEGR